MVRQVRALGGEDCVVLAAAQADGDLAGDGAADPALQALAQHQALRIEPAALVQQPTELAALRAVRVDRTLVVDAVDQALVGEEEQRHAGRLVDATALRLDDAVLDLVGHAEPVAAADRVGLHHEGDLVGELTAVDGDGPALVEADRHLLRLDRDGRVPVPHAHDRRDDVHRLGQELERLGLVCGAPDVGVGRVGLLGAVAVRQVVGDEPLAHLLAAAELVHELLVQPRLVDAQQRVDEQAVAVEPLDVVALVRRAIAPDRDVVIAHRGDEHRAGDRAAKRRGVEVRAATGADVERTALQRNEALADQLGATIDEARALGAVLQGTARDVVEVGLVVLAEVRGVRKRDAALVAHPRDGGRGVEAAGERDTDALTDGKRGEDVAHTRNATGGCRRRAAAACPAAPRRG